MSTSLKVHSQEELSSGISTEHGHSLGRGPYWIEIVVGLPLVPVKVKEKYYCTMERKVLLHHGKKSIIAPWLEPLNKRHCGQAFCPL